MLQQRTFGRRAAVSETSQGGSFTLESSGLSQALGQIDR